MSPLDRSVRACGLVLAAGAGTRFGGPKALARTADGTPWVERAVRMLLDAGCSDVLVALGAGADEARPLVPVCASVLIVPDWAEGLGTTLRAGLLAAAATGADAVVVTPVDTPDAQASAVRRVMAAAPVIHTCLVQAVYEGHPGHPVLIGVDRLAEIVPELRGDSGARRALVAHGVTKVECSDLWTGADIDRR